VGGGRFAVRGGDHRLRRGAGGAPGSGGCGSDRRRCRRCRFDRRSTRRRTGATVLGIAGPSNDAWLAGHGAVPVNYGDDLPARLRAAAPTGRIDALLDFFGGGYVAMAVEDLNVPREKIDTIADFAAVERFGVLSAGGADAASVAVVAELADLVARGELEVPIAGVFALDDVRDAYRELEMRHTRGKLVLRP
jgi:NADPH:quinone reductase-like Zn-dependent oxidoreductase